MPQYESAAMKAALRVAERLVAEHQIPKMVAFDPLLLLAIASVIIGAIRLALECSRTEQDAIDAINNPGVLGRWRIRRLVRIELMQRHIRGLDNAVRQSLVSFGPLDSETIQALMTESTLPHTKQTFLGLDRQTQVPVSTALLLELVALVATPEPELAADLLKMVEDAKAKA